MVLRLGKLGVVAAALAVSGGARAADDLGAVLMGAPKYEGATDYRLVPLPLVNFVRGPFFLSSSHTALPAAGLQLGEAGDGFHAGAFLTGALGRKDNATPRVEGLGDIDTSAQIGAFANWSSGPLLVEAGYQHALHADYGSQGYLKGAWTFTPTPRDRAQVSATLDWADRDAMQTWFGVSPQQSSASAARLPAYDASAGLKDVTLAANWQHAFTGHWVALGIVGLKTLTHTAADSPITERRTAVFGGVGALYRF